MTCPTCPYAACIDICPDYKPPKRDRSREVAKRRQWRQANRELYNAQRRAERAANPEHYRKYWRERKREAGAA